MAATPLQCDIAGREMGQIVEVLSRQFTKAAIAAGLLIALYLTWLVAVIGGLNVSGYFDDVSELLASGAAAVLCLLAARRESGPRLRSQWRFLAAAALMWTLGQIYWTLYNVFEASATSVPEPSPADIGFVASLVLAFVAILHAPAAPNQGVARVRIVLDGVITSGSLLFVAWLTTLDTVFRSSSSTGAARAFTLTYPIGDLVIAGIGLSLFTWRLGRRAVVTGLITGGFLLLALADTSFAYLNATGAYANSSDPTDVGWFAGFLLIGLAALVPEERSARARDRLRLTGWQLYFPFVPLAAAVVTVIVGTSAGRHFSRFDVVDGLAVAVAVVFRQFLVLEENRRLNRELEATVDGLRDNEAALRFQGHHDALTGLANRFRFAERAEEALASDNAGLVALVRGDLDGFKDVNDSFGHDVGDEILIEVGRRVSACAPAGSTIARIGADEFAVLVDGAERLESVMLLTELIGESIEAPFRVRGGTVRLTVCIGVATAVRGQAGFDLLMRNADIALDAAKRRGRGERHVFNRELGEQFRDRAALRAELLPALANGEFFVEYQPIIATESGDTVGLEALLRWLHPSRGVLYPDAFLPLAEATGAISEIGAWVLTESLRHLAHWRASLGGAARDVWMAVNVSARQFVLGDLVGAVASAIAASGLDASALRIELTESLLIEQPRDAIAILEELRDLGVALEIDDFGTGYSSLGYLKRLPVNALKLDQTFINGLGHSTHDNSIVASVIALAHALRLEVIAEGVETEAQLAHLRGLDCDQVQGYLYGRPLSPKRVGEWLSARTPVVGTL